MKINVLIKPNSKHREEVVEEAGGDLVVFTKSLAIENRANEAMVGLLSKHFAVPKSQIKIIRGHTAKNKVVEIGLT